ncbi:M56 family metallopeptidase [Pedobacter sp. PWIIR3]
MEAIVNNLIKAIGWSIFHSLWQGAIVYGVLLLLINTLPGIKARTKHNMAYGALCLMFVGFCIAFFSIFKLPIQNTQVSLGYLENTGTRHFEQILSLPQEINNRTEHTFPYLVGVYLLGLILQTVVLCKGYLKLNKLKKELHIGVPEHWQDIFNNLVIHLNLHQKISFYLTEHVNVPLVIGYLKPIVLFPVALATQLDTSQVEAILIHELSHIRRNDYLLNLIKTVIETVLFFNPFVWLSSKLINIEREHACDDLVVRFTGSPLNYAHALLKLEILKDKSSPAFAMASTGKNQHLYQRIKRITDMKTNYMNAKQQLFAITLTLATVISLAWVSPTKISKGLKTVVNTKKEELVKAINKQNGTASKIFSVNDTTPIKKTAVLADTTKKKRTVKIVTIDEKGNEKEYRSLKEVPDSLKLNLILDSSSNFSFKFDNFKGLDSLLRLNTIFLKSPEFKAQIETQTKFLKSPEFKAQMQEQLKFFRSPEFKAQTLALSKNALELAKKANSAEFKAQVQEFHKNGEAFRLMFTSPENKKQLEELKELQKTPEYKKLKEKFDKDLKKLKEKKGIKSDLTVRNNSVYIADPATASTF